VKDVKDLSLEELQEELFRMGEPAFRAGQIFDWLYQKGAARFEDMTNLGRELRAKLGRTFAVGRLELVGVFRSKDRAEKYVFRLHDGRRIESVLIPAEGRMMAAGAPGSSASAVLAQNEIIRSSREPKARRLTVCVSTQVGCKFACAFCASGRHGFVRHLTASEIVGQVLYFKEHLGAPPTNIVFMGMGEPFDNFENLTKAVGILNAPRGLAVAARRMTVSTAGLIPGIERFGKLGLQVNLSVSLHAATEAQRSALMPINRKYPLEKLLAACEDYLRAGGRKITLEYVLLKKVNDTAEDAARLARIAARLRAKVNLIPFSPVAGLPFEVPEESRVEAFERALEVRGVPVTRRDSKGRDIQAACGQLAFLD